jgi:PA domain
MSWMTVAVRLSPLCACCLMLAPAPASARASVRIEIEAGDALSDPTPVAPVGGNAGTTLGEQRRLALDYAARVWGDRLDSSVPITVGVTFEPLPCSGSASVLGAAATTALFSGISSGGANPDFYYPSALANKLAGRDLDPSEPEIRMQLNSDVDAACKAGTGGFYYGFDGKGEQGVDFAETVLHELAHGLGLASFADPESGELFASDAVDPYTALVRDLDLDKLWPALSDAERATSAGDFRRVAWDGERARNATAQQFAKGVPALAFEPAVVGFSGVVSDSSFGQNSALHSASGPVRTAQNQGCGSLASANVKGAVVVLAPTRCPAAFAAQSAKDAGAVGALIVSSGSPFSEPVQPLEADAQDVSIPVIAVTSEDAERIRQAAASGNLRASLGGIADQLLGGDALQRPLLFASQPVSASSSISHLEPLIRPQQLMEPITGPVPTHDVSFTLALLADLGWSLTCGNGVLDDGEACDDGAKNSDVLPDRCRSDCKQPSCGDGVKDSNEACDGDNDDERANACRTNCELPACGDGIVDDGEECDDGRNSNSDARGATCRVRCRKPACGDGVVDEGEECDDGTRNSDTRAGACRSECKKAHCGDGVVDPGETCDGSTGCSGECTRGGVESGSKTRESREQSDVGERADEAADASADSKVHRSECGCRVVRGAPPPRTLVRVWSALMLGLALWRCRRRRLARARSAERRASRRCSSRSSRCDTSPSHPAPSSAPTSSADRDRRRTRSEARRSRTRPRCAVRARE